jgi:tetratricopeptide (TPR) repeat protein
MFFSGKRYGLMLTSVTALLVGGIIFFNDVNIQIRMREVKLFLQRSNRSDNSIDHIGLVMKYRLHKDMYENRISNEELNIAEVRVNSILAGLERENIVSPVKYRYATIPVAYMINFIRYLIGMPPLREPDGGVETAGIDAAYYYERNRLYHRAIEEYSKILKEGVADRTLNAGVLLHQGYCYSILGDFDNARKLYISVIKDFGEINVAVTAALLLRYIEGFRSEIERVVKNEKDSIEKGEKLYKLIAYRESIEVLNRVEKTVPQSEKAHISYIRGRTYEELGDTGKAIDIYQDIVMENSSSQYAKDANRRIFIVGGLSAENAKVRELAMKNSAMLNDNAFGKLVEESERFISTDKDAVQFRPENDKLPGDNGERAQRLAREKKISMMIEKVEEKISGGDKSVKSVVQPSAKRGVKIYTIDGNIFTGILVSESGSSVTVRTSFGDIKIEKSRISRRISL